MLPATVSASYAFMVPVATPPNAIAFSYGYLKVYHMVRTACSIGACAPMHAVALIIVVSLAAVSVISLNQDKNLSTSLFWWFFCV
jgi:sodium-dependent dicarboxylate transporter 2/3/5